MIQCHNTEFCTRLWNGETPEVVPSHAKEFHTLSIGKMRMLFTGNSSAWEANKFYQ
ncbi:hypothetical protein glysoja_002475 [Glycine soja]|nr:hypothetical protein glysoja_002475 [Glycine soja]